MLKSYYKLSLLICLSSLLSGCFMTKVVTVPMRISGAIISIVPVVGNTADAIIDTTADLIDDIPL